MPPFDQIRAWLADWFQFASNPVAWRAAHKAQAVAIERERLIAQKAKAARHRRRVRDIDRDLKKATNKLLEMGKSR